MYDTLKEMRTCHEVGQWLQSHLDGELDASLTAQVEDHLETCVRCGMEIETYARIKRALHEAAGHSPFLIEDEVALQRLRRFADQLAGHNIVEE
jgi:anti-sigma factor RsiW